MIACGLVAVAGVHEVADTQRRVDTRASGAAWAASATTAVALLGGAVAIAAWGALTIQSYDLGIRGFDSLWYHLPWAASFAQTRTRHAAAASPTSTT